MRTKLYLLNILLIGLLFQSCKEDEINDPTNPVINTAESVDVTRGENMQIQATISHELGLSNIHLYQPEWDLDRVIELKDEMPKTFDLNYTFAIPADAKDEASIELTATSIGGNTTKATQLAKVTDSQNIYLHGHNLVGVNAEWTTPANALLMKRSETDPNIYSVDVEFMGGGGADSWGVALAIIGQTSGVLPFNAVVDVENVDPSFHDTSWWWNGNNYEESSNYPGYVIFDENAGEMTFPMVTDENASIPSWDSEPGFYNIQPLSFYDSPGKYKVLFNIETMELTIKLTQAPLPPAPEQMYIISGGIDGLDDNSWYNPSLATEMTRSSEGIFEGTYTFKDIPWDDATGEYGVFFAFLGQTSDYNPINYGVDQNGENPTGNDSWPLTPPVEVTNVDSDLYIPYYISSPGSYKITVNTITNICTVVKQ
ncbi:hypothetical protein [Flammeovirga kamogawensis]|uniref:DUF4625 domain-containing protein n=1 Tax=Flammeovirga kamogawensis TaxID=373891 RepID=A0ABX8GYJ9_9BACT|nr:hypothetical protein [Flammeovirga kamogawensis]MBB6459051.1 hypothetical protein [Flammeovirga kamogawensis]QWG08621.1 DUF4625 domain-containing protein [Flammeovirga kamogawensis]TRX66914.1 hypothetical protein EO216_01750 [Flammeovirga kamogawensis]